VGDDLWIHPQELLTKTPKLAYKLSKLMIDKNMRNFYYPHLKDVCNSKISLMNLCIEIGYELFSKIEEKRIN